MRFNVVQVEIEYRDVRFCNTISAKCVVQHQIVSNSKETLLFWTFAKLRFPGLR